jgi:acetylcholinesterase
MNINSGRQLFHRVIIESGGPTSRAVHPFNSGLHQDQFVMFLIEVGCAHVPSARLMQCLREVPSARVIQSSNDVFMKSNPSVRWAWQPVLDDEIISRRPTEAWASENWNKVPILTGFNHNEGTMYVPKDMDTSAEFEQFFATLLPQLSQSDLKRLVDLYPDPATVPDSPYVDTRNLGVGSQYKRAEAAYGQYAYVCPVRQTAHLGSRDASNPPIYLYHWATNRTVLGGANHADQMGYETMDPNVRTISPTQEQIAGYFHAYLTSFIVSGNPNKIPGRFSDRPKWEVFNAWNRNTMLFGKGNDERAGGGNTGVVAQLVGDDWAKEECEFWWDQSSNFED